MCLDQFPADDAGDRLPNTDPASASGVAVFNGLLRKLKRVTANAAGVKRLRRLATLQKYYASERGRAMIQAYAERNRPKRNAYNKMRGALKNGDLVKSDRCEQCDTTGRIEAHHDDYAKPLVVRWLCRQCHKTWHRKNGKALNG